MTRTEGYRTIKALTLLLEDALETGDEEAFRSLALERSILLSVYGPVPAMWTDPAPATCA